MIRVTFVLQEPTPYRTPHLATVAARPGLDVKIVYAARTLQRRMWSVPEPSARTIYLDGVSLPAVRLLQHDYALTPGVWPLLNRLRPDVLVVGGWSVMATQLAIAWARLHHTPYLLMSDNHLREPRPGWVRAIKSVVLRGIVPQAAGWLVPGTLGREHILAYGGRSERTIVFPLTIDVERTTQAVDARRAERVALRRQLGVADDAIVVLTAGRLIPQKAVDMLIESVARARSSVSELHLLVAGSGPEQDRLRALAASRHVPTTFTGFLTPEALLDSYAAADLFCLLSRRETWGVVVNEAAAAGLPLVLSENVGAAADLLVVGENGELVPPDDPDSAAAAIVRLASDDDLRRGYGTRSRELVASWTYEPSVESLERLVRQVAA